MLANINFEYWNECYQQSRNDKTKPKTNKIRYMASVGRRELEILYSQRYRPVNLPEPSRRLKELLRVNFGSDGGTWRLPLVSNSPRTSGACGSSTTSIGQGGGKRKPSGLQFKAAGKGVTSPGEGKAANPSQTDGKLQPAHGAQNRSPERQLASVSQSDPGLGVMPVTRRRGHSSLMRDKQAAAGGVSALKTAASSPNVL